MKEHSQNSIEVWRRLAALLIFISLILSIILSYILDVSWDRDDCVSIIVIVGPPLALGSVLIRFNKVPAFADFLTLSSLILAFSMIAVALALLGTRSPAPIADPWLTAADEILPFSAIDVVVSTKYLPEWAIWMLRKSYVQTGIYLYLSLNALLLTGREASAWRMFLVWGWIFLAISLMAFASPALGVFSQLTVEQVEHLPKGAGRYAMRSFHDFRNATEPVLALGHASGVITFPSFHVACALVLAQAWHGFRIIGLLSKLLAGIIILSCVPIGGHYLVDLAAGAAVWWWVTLAVDQIGRMKIANSAESAIAMSPA